MRRPLVIQRSRRMQRRGAATIEFAICLPFLTLILLASMECTNYIFLRQAVVQASYEGTKIAVDPQSTTSAASQRIHEVLRGRNIKNASIKFKPSDPSTKNRGEKIEVTVTANTSGNRMFGLPGFSNRNVSVTTTMVRE